MSGRSERIAAAIMVVRDAIDEDPGRPGLLRVVFDMLVAERDADPTARDHTLVTPERGAALIGITANRMRRLCHLPGVGMRANGRWLVRPEWLAGEIVRRRALGLLS